MHNAHCNNEAVCKYEEYWKIPLACLNSNVNRKCIEKFTIYCITVHVPKQDRNSESERERQRKKWQPETINSKRKSKIDLRSSSLWCCVSAYKLCTHQTILISSPSIYIVSTLLAERMKWRNLDWKNEKERNSKSNQNGTHIQFHNIFFMHSSSHSMCMSLITSFSPVFAPISMKEEII